MHLYNILLSLAAAGFAAADPLEERAAQSCSVQSIHNIVTAVYRPSAVPFCNSYLSAPTKTVTKQITQTSAGQQTVIKQTTVTSVVTQTSTVKVNARDVEEASADQGDVLLERRATGTPSRLRTLSPAMLSSVCGCLTTLPTTTITSTHVISPTAVTTQFSTITVTQTTTAIISQTAAASRVPFYLKVAKTSGTTIDGQYGLVNGETMTFVTTTTAATKFTIDAAGNLVSGTNGAIANIQKGITHSTLFFDTPDVIAEFSLVQATCSRKTGHLKCVDQTADTLFWCIPGSVGQIVIAGAGYEGPGCLNVTLNAINA